MTALLVIFHSRGRFIVILEEYIIAMENSMSWIISFSADLVPNFSNEIDIFIKFAKNENSSMLSWEFLMQKFWSWYLMGRFSE